MYVLFALNLSPIKEGGVCLVSAGFERHPSTIHRRTALTALADDRRPRESGIAISVEAKITLFKTKQK